MPESQRDLFAAASAEHPYQEVADRLARLAQKRIYFGSSSWKYESWQGPVYAERYTSKKDFERNCLEEYARLFPAVGGDFSFYAFPSEELIGRLNSQTPAGFKFGLKATELITLKRFPQIARWGEKAGKENPDFLNAKLFSEQFLERVRPLLERDKLAPLILEFTAFPRGAFHDWTEFAMRLETFLDEICRLAGPEFEFGVEVRAKDCLHGDFYAALKAMGVAPILSSWTRLPPLDEQWKLFPAHDFPFVECRAVMRPGRTRDEAVTLFEPYDRSKETVPPARRAIKTMVAWALERDLPAYFFINNHLEGCAHQTIAELSRELEPLDQFSWPRQSRASSAST